MLSGENVGMVSAELSEGKDFSDGFGNESGEWTLLGLEKGSAKSSVSHAEALAHLMPFG